MHERYTYLSIRVERGTWPGVAASVWGPVDEALRADGAMVIGLWAAEIGAHTDEGVLMCTMETVAHPALEAIDSLIESSTERVVATVRPTDRTPQTAAGIYAHRWFETTDDRWPEFLELSEGAWPHFETAHPGTEILGFFRSLDVDAPRCRILLVTRYPDLATWERSRPYAPKPTEGTEESRRRFRRRAELTDRTVVRILRPVVSSSA
jgi:hypothetical protein